MENKLRAYMDHLFQDVPNTKKAVEVKEEILQNIVDKYHDLVAEGKSEEAAYNIAIASIGDLDELLASLKDSSQTPNQMDSENYMAWRKKSAIRISIAIMLDLWNILKILCHNFDLRIYYCLDRKSTRLNSSHP